MSWWNKLLGREAKGEDGQDRQNYTDEQDRDSYMTIDGKEQKGMSVNAVKISKYADKPKPKTRAEFSKAWRDKNKDKVNEYEKARRQSPERKAYMKELHKKRQAQARLKKKESVV